MSAEPYMPNSPHKSPLRICDLCFRQCGGSVVQYRASAEFPAYHSCSNACDDILLELIISGQGYIDQARIDEATKKAIDDAREAFFHELNEMGKWGQIGGITDQLYKKIDAVVLAVFCGVAESMRAQSVAALPPVKEAV